MGLLIPAELVFYFLWFLSILFHLLITLFSSHPLGKEKQWSLRISNDYIVYITNIHFRIGQIIIIECEIKRNLKSFVKGYSNDIMKVTTNEIDMLNILQRISQWIHEILHFFLIKFRLELCAIHVGITLDGDSTISMKCSSGIIDISYKIPKQVSNDDNGNSEGNNTCTYYVDYEFQLYQPEVSINEHSISSHYFICKLYEKNSTILSSSNLFNNTNRKRKVRELSFSLYGKDIVATLAHLSISASVYILVSSLIEHVKYLCETKTCMDNNNENNEHLDIFIISTFSNLHCKLDFINYSTHVDKIDVRNVRSVQNEVKMKLL